MHHAADIDPHNPLWVGVRLNSDARNGDAIAYARRLSLSITELFQNKGLSAERAFVQNGEAFILFPFPLLGPRVSRAGIILHAVSTDPANDLHWRISIKSYPVLTSLALEDIITLTTIQFDLIEHLSRRDDSAEIEAMLLNMAEAMTADRD